MIMNIFTDLFDPLPGPLQLLPLRGHRDPGSYIHESIFSNSEIYNSSLESYPASTPLGGSDCIHFYEIQSAYSWGVLYICLYANILHKKKWENCKFTKFYDGSSMKLIDKFTYLVSSVSSMEEDINARQAKAWTAIDWLSVIWKSDLCDEIKRSFFQAVVVSILLYGCTIWTLTKHMEKKLDGNYTRILRAILNKSWRQHLTKQ